MAFTQADIDAIDVALKSNVLIVKQPGGGEVRYRTVDEMLKVRALAITEVATNGSNNVIRHHRIFTSKGFDD